MAVPRMRHRPPKQALVAVDYARPDGVGRFIDRPRGLVVNRRLHVVVDNWVQHPLVAGAEPGADQRAEQAERQRGEQRA